MDSPASGKRCQRGPDMVELNKPVRRSASTPPLVTPKPGAGERRGAGEALRIGLINNMPDAALRATERQFSSLISAAADRLPVSLELFFLPEIERCADARAMMRGRYAHVDDLPRSGLDGLIVTGAEPRTEKLDDEVYWPSLAGVIDWARTGTKSTVWSCLAAHAAVLRLDGVARLPLERKLSGVFTFERDRANPLLSEAPTSVRTPHSRMNGLAEEDLVARGYDVLTRSSEAGVDAFVREGQSLFLFLQGHPEYEVDSLAREYRRDVTRFLAGEAAAPQPPSGYFNTGAEEALRALSARLPGSRDPAWAAEFDDVIKSATFRSSWRPHAVRLFANWLAEIGRRKLADAVVLS